MRDWVHGLLRSKEGYEGHFRYSTEGQSLAEYIKVIEEKHDEGCEVLWIAKGFIPIDPENWPGWDMVEEHPKPKFFPDDAGRYVAVKGTSGNRFGIVIEVLDEEDARIWHPNLNREEGGQGTARIINISEVTVLGDWVGAIKYPAEFFILVEKADLKEMEYASAPGIGEPK